MENPETRQDPEPPHVGTRYPDPTADTRTNTLPKFQSIAPVFSTSDLPRWLGHYRALGFEVRSHDGGTDTGEDEYGFATRDGVRLHVSVNPDHDPLRTAGCAYLYVEDADALYAAWSAATGTGAGASVGTGRADVNPSTKGVDGEVVYTRNVAPVDTPYGLREGAHLDPDNNLLRYGSRIEKM